MKHLVKGKSLSKRKRNMLFGLNEMERMTGISIEGKRKNFLNHKCLGQKTEGRGR